MCVQHVSVKLVALTVVRLQVPASWYVFFIPKLQVIKFLEFLLKDLHLLMKVQGCVELKE
jgi:hypothetical protein